MAWPVLLVAGAMAVEAQMPLAKTLQDRCASPLGALVPGCQGLLGATNPPQPGLPPTPTGGMRSGPGWAPKGSRRSTTVTAGLRPASTRVAAGRAGRSAAEGRQPRRQPPLVAIARSTAACSSGESATVERPRSSSFT